VAPLGCVQGFKSLRFLRPTGLPGTLAASPGELSAVLLYQPILAQAFSPGDSARQTTSGS